MKSTVSGSAPFVVACVAAAASFIATGPTARAADAQQPVTRVATKQKVVALTFDDGPNPEHAPKYLKLFKDEGVKATFFVMHEWSAKTLEAMPEIIRRLKAKGLAFVTVSELLDIDKPKPPAAHGK